MKSIKKSIKGCVILFLLALCIPFLGACVEEEPPERTIGRETERMRRAAERFAHVDLGGFHFTVADPVESRWEPTRGSTAHANRILDRNHWVEHILYANIDWIAFDMDQFRFHMTSGDHYAHMIVSQTHDTARIMLNRHSIDLSEIEQLQFHEYWWTNFNAIDNMIFAGRAYAKSASFASQIEYTHMMMFNRNIIEELGLECPHVLVADNRWNMETMLQMQRAARADLDGDSMWTERDRYGVANAGGGHWGAMSVALFLATGLNMTEQSPAGYYESIMLQPDNIQGLLLARSLIEPIVAAPPARTGGRDMFAEGRLLFVVGGFSELFTPAFMGMEDDFGLVPMPMGPWSNDYRNFTCLRRTTIAVPTTVQSPQLREQVGYMIEALAYVAFYEQEERFIEMSFIRLRDYESLWPLQMAALHSVNDFMDLAYVQGGESSRPLNTMIDIIQNAGVEPTSTLMRYQNSINQNLRDAQMIFLGQMQR